MIHVFIVASEFRSAIWIFQILRCVLQTKITCLQINASVVKHELFCWYNRTAINLRVIVNLGLLKGDIIVLLQRRWRLASPSSDLMILNVLVPRRSSHNISSVDVVKFTDCIGPCLTRLLSIIELSNSCTGHYNKVVWACTTCQYRVLSAAQLAGALRCSLSSACTHTNTRLVWSIYGQREYLNGGWAELSPGKSLRHIVSQPTASWVSHYMMMAHVCRLHWLGLLLWLGLVLSLILRLVSLLCHVVVCELLACSID